MKGPADLIEALEDPERYGGKYVRNMISSFVPASVGMGYMARAADPYSRQARTTMDAIKAKIPGLSETLMPRRDIWGRPIMQKEALGGRGVTNMYMVEASSDPVNLLMLNLGVFPAPVQRTIRNVELTPEQYDDYARIAGGMAKQRLDQIVLAPQFSTFPSSVQHDVIEETIKQSREAARGVVMMKYPQIPHDAAAQRRKDALGE